MQDITGVKLPFGGKIAVLGGDFRQVLPVVRRGTRAQIVDSSLRMSPLWTIIKKMRLTINMRARTDPWFSNFLLRVGDRVEETRLEMMLDDKNRLDDVDLMLSEAENGRLTGFESANFEQKVGHGFQGLGAYDGLDGTEHGYQRLELGEILYIR
ncbi:ATP-dependent DNA helicase PIF1-like protein [Tanacetum coccineum]